MINLIHQCVSHGEEVYIIDAKGGADYQQFSGTCILAVEPDEIDMVLHKALRELDNRKQVCSSLGLPTIGDCNRQEHYCYPYKRVVVVVDELAEVLNKSTNKESKAQAAMFEDALSKVARLGRAFQINLILGTQRPDATVVSGQIRNNCDTRICGRCSNNLALVVHDDAQAAQMIPSTARGRFLTQEHQLFQGYMTDEDTKGGSNNG